jgi:Mg2+/Co2+ transporter CorB
MIPESGTCLKIDAYPIEIIETNENRVQLARIYQLDEAKKNN